MEQPKDSSLEQTTSESKKKRKINAMAKVAAIGLTMSLPSGSEKQNQVETWEQMKERAKIEMAEKGITSEQQKGTIPVINKLAYKSITPSNYASDWKELLEILKKNKDEGRKQLSPGREDAWRIYLGLPQEHHTFGVSDYRPGHSHENKYYFKINDFINHSQLDIQKIIGEIEYKKQYPKSRILPPTDMEMMIMGIYSWSKGEDERGHFVSYYDKWDLSDPIEGKTDLIGKPFEIYDRIYYNPETFEIINP